MSNPTAVDLFSQDLRAKLQKENPKGYDHRAAKALGLSQLLIAVMNWRVRLIPPRPRTVRVSEAMREQSETTEHQEVLETICRKLQAGVDITPHLSKMANSISLHRDQDSPERRAKRRFDLDAMLSDWGVYHLHLSTELEPESGYVERGDDLLFLLIGPHDARLIGIYKHEEWAKEDVARTIVTEWLEHSKFHELSPGMAPVEEITPDMWQEMRDSGISPILTIDGRHFITGDMTLAATSATIIQVAGYIIGELEGMDEQAASTAFLYQPAARDGWYGLEDSSGFQPMAPLPWWYDGRHWAPTP